MRNNQPVTDHEIALRDDSLIVSKTDLKGQITYVNQEFLDISGFAEAELIGEPHNIVRHPDMPVEAFADLWRDLQEGRPWTGLIKNRCKNGDCYWVLATVTPLRASGGEITGYLSLRRKATAPQIEAAENAYRLFREKRHGSRCISNGAVVSSGLLARAARRFRDAAIASKLMLVCLPLIFAVMVGTSLFLGRHISTTIEATLIGELRQQLGLIRGMVDVRANAMRLEAIRLNDVFTGFFPDGFTLEPGDDLPVLKSGKTTVNQRYEEIDRFSGLSGAVATIFVRKNDDFVRIATSLKNEKGERAIGTFLAQDHPGRSKLLSGERYVGRANLFGKDFYTSYTPIKRADGQVIGASFIGVDVSVELAALRQQIKAVKIGETGYFYVIDGRPGKGQGTLVVHPAKEGVNILDAKDASGREFIKEMIEKKQGEIRYPWVNPELGETSPREKIVEFDTYPEWQWVIGGGSYVDEFDRVSRPTIRSIWLISLFVVSILAIAIYLLISRLVRKPLQEEVLSTMTLLASGKYDNQLKIARNDEIGKVMQGLQSMQIQQGFNVAESTRVANENQRIKTGLDCVSGNVRIADNDGRITYVNETLLNTLQVIEGEIRKDLPNFDVSKVVGSDIGVFYKDPAAALQSMRELSATRRTEMLIGGRNMRVITSPIINNRGERLGSVGEWIDRTNELAVESEVGTIVAAAANGDFTQRVSIAGKEGFFLQLAHDLNQLLDTCQRGLDDVVDVLEALAQGDLTKRIEADYAGSFGQMKNDANATAENLSEIVGQIKNAADAINTAAKEISSGNQDLSSRTEEQASSLEETASSMEQLTGTVRQNADNARQANQLAGNAQQVAEKAGAVVGQVVGTMSAIHQSSSKISDIIGVIDGIAFQTNILALNAAVEAARAGEQGRGFAVVATEVRSLAQRSAAAAREIKGLISDSVEKVETGNKLVDQAGRTMEEVVSSIKGVARIMADIAEATGEQSAGIQQIGLAVGQMDEMTQQNAALVEEAAAAAESLEEQAQSLTQSVSVFRLTESQPMALSSAHRETPALNDKSSRFSAQRSGQKPLPKLAASLDDEWHEF